MPARDAAPPAPVSAPGTALPAWAAYTLALALGGGAVALGVLVFADAASLALLVCLAAVAVSTWLGGPGPGLLAAVSGAVAGGVLPATPERSPARAIAGPPPLAGGPPLGGGGGARGGGPPPPPAARAHTPARIAQGERDAQQRADAAIAEGERRASAAIAANEARFRTLLAGSADAFVLLDGGGRIRFASPAASMLLDLDPGRADGAEFAALVHRDDAAHLRALLDRGGAVTLRLWGGDGWRWTEATRSDLRDDPAVRATLVNFRDVTWRVRAEERDALLRDAARYLLTADLGDEGADALAAVAEVAVPRFAAGCAVELAEDGGALRRAFTALPPALPPDAPDPFAAAGVSAHVVRALMTGQAAAFAPLPDAPATMLVAPLAARGRVLGAVTFAAGERGPFDADDAATAALFAGYLALALAPVRP